MPRSWKPNAVIFQAVESKKAKVKAFGVSPTNLLQSRLKNSFSIQDFLKVFWLFSQIIIITERFAILFILCATSVKLLTQGSFR